MELEIIIKDYPNTELKRAKKHVKRLKSWYWLIPTNILVTATLAALSYLMYQNGEPNTIIWILMSSPSALWVIFIVEGIVLNKTKAVDAWEERQIRKYY